MFKEIKVLSPLFNFKLTSDVEMFFTVFRNFFESRKENLKKKYKLKKVPDFCESFT